MRTEVGGALFREHGAAVGIVSGYLAATYAAYATLGTQTRHPLDTVGWYVLVVLAAFAVIWAIANALAARVRGESLLARRTWSGLLRRAFTGSGLAGLVVVLLFFWPFIGSFLWWKRMIPVLHPFGHPDAALATLERTLHFGVDPWRLTHAVLGEVFTRILDAVYGAGWFLVILAYLMFWALRPHSVVRVQFFVAVFLTWPLLGNLVATLVSSAGPCFYVGATGDADFYAPLLARLDALHADAPLIAREAQLRLWELHLARSPANPGVSAFPSLHVAVPALFALAGFRLSGWVGWIFVALTGLTFVASVHLGWHYALDGYASIALVPCVWRLAGMIAGWWTLRFPPRSSRLDPAARHPRSELRAAGRQRLSRA